jgi:hypothetical protein
MKFSNRPLPNIKHINEITLSVFLITASGPNNIFLKNKGSTHQALPLYSNFSWCNVVT